MSLADDVRAFLLSRADIADKVSGQQVHYLRSPQKLTGNYVWFRRSTAGDDEDRCLASGGQVNRFRESFDIEAVTRDFDDVDDLAAAIKVIDGYRGTFGNGTVQALFVRDHADDYQPFNVAGDDGVSVATAELEVVGYEPGS